MFMQMVHVLLFITVTGYGLLLFGKAVYRRFLYVRLGQPYDFRQAGRERLAGFLGEVFGQRKLLKDRRSGVMHIVLFYGFLVLQLGALDLIYKGLTNGQKLPVPGYEAFNLLQELTIAAVLAAVGYAAYRRYVERLPRLKRGWKPSLVVWFIVGLLLSVLLSLAFERIWLGHTAGQLDAYAPISSVLASLMSGMSPGAAKAAFYVSWWVHLLILLSFLVYVPQSKHFHLITAPINLWLRRKEPVGRLRKLELEDEQAESFGAGRVEDFTQKQLLDLYACVECGRCTNVCPASSTGKALSPMHLITKLRDHLTEKGAAVTSRSPWVPELVFGSSAGSVHRMVPVEEQEQTQVEAQAQAKVQTQVEAQARERAESQSQAQTQAQAHADDGTSAPLAATDIRPTLAWQQAAWQAHADGTAAVDVELIGGVIREEELWSCTTCRNCEDQCPVGNEHVDKIIDMRRHLVLMQGSLPHEAQRAMQSIERQGNPWGLSRSDRAKWTADVAGVKVPTVKDNPDFELLFFVGSMGSYDERSRKVSRALVRLLHEAGVSFAILGSEERGSGDTPRRLGNELLFQQLCMDNIEVFRRYGVKRIVTACPHTYNTLKNEYSDFGMNGVEVLHHSELLAELVATGRLKPTYELKERITYHDSCYLGRYNNVYDQPREVLRAIPGVELVELERSRDNGMCCGAGGGLMWMEETAGTRMNVARTEQVLAVQPTVISSACPYCLTMLADGTKLKEADNRVKTRDIAELLELSVFGSGSE
ncbi:(Fe-S)-binding protein [Paenibacillus sp. YYML68]|uniref:heterodisulfide reductase-related iron-sulfur binding cluster n=1 Tax=Paenibacillus sp. YYML68 TaxID=2909250 RepID=UPI00249316D7|nr:(Fe-S)-binding protein [Paenibacillus sp. YYML68]